MAVWVRQNIVLIFICSRFTRNLIIMFAELCIDVVSPDRKQIVAPHWSADHMYKYAPVYANSMLLIRMETL